MDILEYIKYAESFIPNDNDSVFKRRNKLGITNLYYKNIHSFQYMNEDILKENSDIRYEDIELTFKFLEELSYDVELNLLDVGAGYGQILYYFYNNSNINKLHGIEIDTDYVSIFNNKLLSLFNNNDDNRVKIFNMDAFDFENYDDYNVMWTYSPIKNDYYCMSLYDKIISQLNKKTYFIDFDFGHKYNFMMERGAPIEIFKKIGKMKIFIYNK